MAFDLYASENHESIANHEEFIFALAEQQKSLYPELLAVWAVFYNDPRLSANQSGAITHELIALLANNAGFDNKPLAAIVTRLLPFFSSAFTKGLDIRCVSD